MSQNAAKKAKLENDKPNFELAEMLSGIQSIKLIFFFFNSNLNII